MTDRPVALTGLGVVTAAGIGVEQFWQAALDGESKIRRISLFDPAGFRSQVAGEVDDFSARKFVPKNYRKAVKVMARDIEIAVAAADLAFRDSGLVTKGIDPDNINIDSKRLGCNIGAGLMCSNLDELASAVTTALVDGKFDLKKWGESGINNLTPLWLLKYLPNMLSCHVTIIHGAEGPSNAITCGAASGHLAMGESARLIARGDSDAVIAGGAESKLNPMGFLRQELLLRTCISRNDDPAQASRPFDAAHDGVVVGEGGGLIIMEDIDHATGRGANIYAEMVGFGAACDPAGIDVTKPNAGSLDLAVSRALADAGITADQVDMIAAHGTGSPGEDDCEAAAWAKALGDAIDTIPSVATTGLVGSMFAGAGGVSAALAAMALQKQTVPPTTNFQTPAKHCRLQLSNQPRKAELNYVLTGAFSVGGQSAACVLKRHNP